MNTLGQIQANALDTYLTALQAGQRPPRPADVPEDEITLLENLVVLVAANPPEAAFAIALENRLRYTHAQQRRTRNMQTGASPGIERSLTMQKILAFAAIGVTVLTLMLCGTSVLGLALWNRGISVAQNTPGVPTVVTPPSTATMAPPTNTPAPTPLFATPPVLPALASLPGQGTGGGGGITTKLTYSLSAPLPENPGPVMVYLQNEARPLTVEYAQQVSKQWGLEAAMYMPLWMATVQDQSTITQKNYIAVAEPRELSIESTDLLNYIDKKVAPVHNGHWNPPQNPPSAPQAVETARNFLATRGLLNVPYQVLPPVYPGDPVRFVRQLDAHRTLWAPFALVFVGADNQVGNVTYRNIDLVPLAQYPVISAQTAWEQLSAGQPAAHIWLRAPSAIQQNPKYWARAYRAGQRADLFGTPRILFPADPNGALHATLNDLVLFGDLKALVQHAVDSQAPLHIWGEVRDEGGYLSLQMAGWEEISETAIFWHGTVRRQGEQASLEIEDGTTFALPEIPADVPDGATVFVEGGQAGNRLEWYILQLPPAEITPAPATEVRAVVEKVGLVYFIPSPESLPADAAKDLGYRAAQPIWRFSGHTDLGAEFEADVQALPDEYVK